jgi:hypothetical protein
MFVQGAAFSYVYPHLFPNRSAVLRNGLLYGLGLALLSWSFTTLAVAAKNVMTSVPTYMALETEFHRRAIRDRRSPHRTRLPQMKKETAL